MDPAGITKPHFVLGRVHVDIHLGRVEIEVQYKGRVTAVSTGTANITASCAGKQSTATLTVTAATQTQSFTLEIDGDEVRDAKPPVADPLPVQRLTNQDANQSEYDERNK